MSNMVVRASLPDWRPYHLHVEAVEAYAVKSRFHVL